MPMKWRFAVNGDLYVTCDRCADLFSVDGSVLARMDAREGHETGAEVRDGEYR